MAHRVAGQIDQELATPSNEELANAAAFDGMVSSLPGMLEELRPRRWISRIGSLLRVARAHSEKGQADISKLAHVTQPYLSRLENGLLPKRGPTVEVLLRCFEAAGCDVEISVRSKKDGTYIGRLSSADLETAEWPAAGSDERMHLITTTPPHRREHASASDELNVVFSPRPRKTKNRTLWLGTRDLSGRRKWTQREQQYIERFAKTVMRTRKGQSAPVVKTVDASNAKSNTVKVHEGDLVVLGSASDLTRALGIPEGTQS